MSDARLEEFSIDSKEQTLIETFTSWMKDSETYHAHLLKYQKVSEEYYKGNQTERDAIAARSTGNTDTVENRIFETIETIVPVATSKAHQFIVLPGSENEKSVARANSLQKVLTRKYETLEMQKKLEETTRNMILYRFGVMKWCWSYENDDIDVEVKDPRLILVPRMRLDPHNLPYKIEIQEYTRKEMEEYWPKANIDDFTPEEKIDVGGNYGAFFGKKMYYRVYEVWAYGEMVAWFCCNKLLEKKANPYYDFKGTERKYMKKGKKGTKISKRLMFSNVFDRPTDPYVFFSTFNVGDEPFGSVSLTEIAIPIQDAINVQKRKIIDNLRKMGNSQIYLDSDAMSEEESQNITDEVGLVIRGEGIASQNKIRREAGTPLPTAHFQNLTHSEATFDNLMGTHGATRGAGGSPTLGQDLVARQQDFSRIDLITRILNRGVSRLAVGLVQLMKMYYTETQTVKILGEDGAVEFVNLNKNDIEDYIEIVVKSGEVLPMDKVALRTEAVQLWQLGALDPVTLFERLEFTNPAKAAERLAAWKQGQLTAETMAKIQEAAGTAQAQAQFAPPTAPTSTKTKTPTGESGKKVESPMNVMQRATANLGGTAPSLPEAPKL